MLQKTLFLVAGLPLALAAVCQQPSSDSSSQPQVKVNLLNVCTPSAEEQKEIAAALARIPKQPAFSQDFEVSHGRSTLADASNLLQPGQNTKVSTDPSVARYVRIRREFAGQSPFSSVQYSFSDDGQNIVETLVLHVRDAKDLIQLSLEDSASSITSPLAMVSANTPVNRVRLERFGKSSIALARCNASENAPAPDQTAYEPLFQSASGVLADYRGLLNVKHTVPEELGQIAGGAKSSGAKSSAKQGKPQ